MLAPDIAQAIQYNLDAAMLNHASQLDRDSLDEWLWAMPHALYGAALRIHAHLLAARPELAARAAR